MRKMKKLLALVLALALALSLVTVPAAAQEPDGQQLTDALVEAFDGYMPYYYFFGAAIQPGQNVPESAAFHYIISQLYDPAYDRYKYEDTSDPSYTRTYYKMPYSVFIAILEKRFVNYSDMKRFLNAMGDMGSYNATTDTVMFYVDGGFGDAVAWDVTNMYDLGNGRYSVQTLVVDVLGYEDSYFDGMTENLDYVYYENYEGTFFKAKILDAAEFIMVMDGDNALIDSALPIEWWVDEFTLYNFSAAQRGTYSYVELAYYQDDLINNQWVWSDTVAALNADIYAAAGLETFGHPYGAWKKQGAAMEFTLQLPQDWTVDSNWAVDLNSDLSDPDYENLTAVSGAPLTYRFKSSFPAVIEIFLRQPRAMLTTPQGAQLVTQDNVAYYTGVDLVAQELQGQAAQTAVSIVLEGLGEGSTAVAYDIHLEKNSQTVSIPEGGKVRVLLPVPAHMSGDLRVYHVDAQGRKTDMKAEYMADLDKITFLTDHFSTFVLVSVANPTTRVFGANRYVTAFAAAELLKEQQGVEKFENIVVACGTNFADALSGSYLAAKKNAPILLVDKERVEDVKAYIRENLAAGGKVYLLGGTVAIPETMDRISGIAKNDIVRLAGANRYGTNLAILEAAGVTNEEILVATGTNFADSLSAAASGRPILMVTGNSLTAEQKSFLKAHAGNELYILGGTAAVSAKMETALKAYDATPTRLAGNNRYDTSVAIAAKFFPYATKAVLAYGRNFPDGLSGGALAYTMKAPLLLAATKEADAAVAYAASVGIDSGVVLGGPGLISDAAVRNIFRLAPSDQITVRG